MVDLGECRPMHARISERQCSVNRQRGMISCEKCDGLMNGKLVSERKLMATNTKKGTCVKCERPDLVIYSRGQCYTCSHGRGKDMTKEAVMAEVAAGIYGERGPRTSARSKKQASTKQPAAASHPEAGNSYATMAEQYEGVEYRSVAPAMDGGSVTDSANDSHLKDLLPPEQPCAPAPQSVLLPPPEFSPPPRKGVYLDLTDYPDLDAWLQETCADVDVSLAIICLLEARRDGRLKLQRVA